MTRPLTPGNRAPERTAWTWQDLLLVLAIVALVLLIVRTANQFHGHYDPHFTISTDISVLPSYTAQTLLRMILGYILSLVFSLVYSYTAYRSKMAARFMLPLLDILQSIPVLSFLPGVTLALISLFPGQRLGVEMAAIVLIFTGMAWNMAFSFYQSLCGIPQELIEASRVYRLNAWERFWSLELPAGAIGLVWNSVMSWAGGWFFLMAIEAFTLGNQSFQLPGLGSFLAVAAAHGNFPAIYWGVSVLIGVVVITDLLVWRPLIAWVEKFKFESVETQSAPQSWVLDLVRRSPTLRVIQERVFQPLQEAFDQRLNRTFAVRTAPRELPSPQNLGQWFEWIFSSGVTIIILWGVWEAALMLRQLSPTVWLSVLLGACFTALRVFTSLILSLLITVPIGVGIGRNPRLAQVLQPIVQVVASVPATALFPILLLALIHLGGGLQVGSIALMILGTMWYVLFNVIAGAQAIPAELFEAALVYKLTRRQRWQTLILPGIFPYLVTGMITAVGGAWNASIVSEYVTFNGQVITTPGLGSIISEASAAGNFRLLLAATVVMSLLVVITNRLVWRPMYHLAQEKYRQLI